MDSDQDAKTNRAAFFTTHWSVVLEAASPSPNDTTEAFARIYSDYWYPLYAYIRRRGFAPADAEDVTQSFFLRLIEYHCLQGLQREGGKFRSFLLRLLDNFLANEWDRAQAQKRGGGRPSLSLDVAAGEARFSREPQSRDTPETLFERQWVFALLALVLENLAAESAAAGKAKLFAELRPHLQGDRQGVTYAEVAARQGMSEGAIKVAVHRLRQRYGELLREEIARTVSSAEEVDQELRHLIAVSAR